MSFDKQAIFNKAVIGLSTQGFRRSMRDAQDGGCAFRGQSGLKCALGHLIDTKVLMGLGWSGVPGSYEPKMSAVYGAVGATTTDERTFLARLVGAHDDNKVPAKMAVAYKRIAEQYSLTIPAELAEFGLVQSTANTF